MYVITADQIGSRADIDRSEAMRRELQAGFGDRLVLPVELPGCRRQCLRRL